MDIPGVGPIIAGGALASALVAGAAAGGLMETLVTLGITENDARYFETRLRQGSVLVTASAGARWAEAREILRACGADLGESGREPAGNPDLLLGREAIMAEGESWRGSERRYHDDLTYAGPERRLSHR
jgi:pyridoxine/pyridoxamine 5'-phosphate oxidase